MSIINVKVSYIRPQFNNLKEWCENSENVYIGRRGVVFINKERYPPKDSIWCNPFKIGKDGNRDEVIQKYETYIRKKIENDHSLQEELKKLKGKCLGCWCAPEPCHGNVLLKIVNEK